MPGQIDSTSTQISDAASRRVGRQPVREVYRYYIETDDPRYAPPTVSDIETIAQRYQQEPRPETSQSQRTLYVVGGIDNNQKPMLIENASSGLKVRKEFGIARALRIENIIRDSIGGVVALFGLAYSGFEVTHYGVSVDSIFVGIGAALIFGEIVLGRIFDYHFGHQCIRN